MMKMLMTKERLVKQMRICCSREAVRITGLLAGTKDPDKEAAHQVVFGIDKIREGIQKQREGLKLQDVGLAVVQAAVKDNPLGDLVLCWMH